MLPVLLGVLLGVLPLTIWGIGGYFQFKMARRWEHSYPWFAFVPVLNVVQVFQIAKIPAWHLLIPIMCFVSLARAYGAFCRMNGERSIFQVYVHTFGLHIFALAKLYKNHRIFIQDFDERESVATLEAAIKNQVPQDQIMQRAHEVNMSRSELKAVYRLARIGVKNNLRVVGSIRKTFMPEVFLLLIFFSPMLSGAALGQLAPKMIHFIVSSDIQVGESSLPLPLDSEILNLMVPPASNDKSAAAWDYSREAVIPLSQDDSIVENETVPVITDSSGEATEFETPVLEVFNEVFVPDIDSENIANPVVGIESRIEGDLTDFARDSSLIDLPVAVNLDARIEKNLSDEPAELLLRRPGPRPRNVKPLEVVRPAAASVSLSSRIE